MSVADTDLLAIYKTLLWGVSIVTFAVGLVGLYRAWKRGTRYGRLQGIWKQAVNKGRLSATRRFLREERPKVVLLVVLLLVLAGLTVAIQST